MDGFEMRNISIHQIEMLLLRNNFENLMDDGWDLGGLFIDRGGLTIQKTI